MARFRVGCVPYVNAVPLIYPFISNPNSPIEVIYDVPSRLPQLHESGKVDAMLVSSIDALRTPNAEVVGGVCIGSNGPVESVRLFSRIPFGSIKTLALDESSMTSNALGQILLSEKYDAKPQKLALPPQIDLMLDLCDAAIIIGDHGMSATYPGARVFDLGHVWTDSYKRPFVWAAWIGHRKLDPELVALLQSALASFKSEPEPVFAHAANASGWDLNLTRRYLTSCVQFEFGYEQVKGLQLFSDKLIDNKILEKVHLPNILPVS